MFLIGDFSNRDYFNSFNGPVFKNNLSQKDLVKAKNDGYFQVIDLDRKKFFDPDKNKWINLPHEI